MAESSANTRPKNFIVDGEFLIQLLECPVCLGQLKSSSRVLPCQHTFCERCLHEVYKANNKLDCPECRTPVNIPFNQLPKNILLMRFLEGVKNKKVRNAEEAYPRSASYPCWKQASLPQSSSSIPSAADVVYKKMKESRDGQPAAGVPQSGTTEVNQWHAKILKICESNDPQYKAIIENLNGNKMTIKVPPLPNTSTSIVLELEDSSKPVTSLRRIEQPLPPSNSAKKISPDPQADENLRRLCEALKASRNLLPKKSTEPKQCFESRFRKRNKHILTKIVRALNYPNYCSYTGPRKPSGST